LRHINADPTVVARLDPERSSDLHLAKETRMIHEQVVAGTLGVVADSASEWFAAHLLPGSGE